MDYIIAFKKSTYIFWVQELRSLWNVKKKKNLENIPKLGKKYLAIYYASQMAVNLSEFMIF